MDADRNLLFGVLALQADLLTPAQFAEACSAWAGRKATPLADLLVERGWLSTADRADVERLLERKLRKYGGDARASLAEAATEPVRRSLSGVADPEIHASLAGPTPPPQGHVLLATTAYTPEVRERYTLSRLHATGGIGRVWLARDASLGREVALKELRPERIAQPALWGRFLKEAQITGQLEHPGIVPIYEVGRRPDDQSPFYTMRFVRGRTLAEAIQAYHRKRTGGDAGPLDLRELLTAFVGVCNAVAYAHSRGVIHRDLKPQNVVLGDFGEVIVLDWGLARVVGEADGDGAGERLAVRLDGEGSHDETVAGQVLGTPAYMAPEQAEGRLDLLDARTDVYGLGAVLYEVLTGSPPFSGEETEEVLRRVVHDAPAPPRRLVSEVPAVLEAICLKALAKRPSDRYDSAKALADEMQHWLADEPVAAFREPVAARLGRWARRNRTFVSVATAAMVVAVVGLSAVLAVKSRAASALAAKNAELEASAERERQRFDLAIEAVGKFHTGVSKDVLLKEPQFKDLRDNLLKDAADFYRKLEGLLQNQTDPRSRRALANAYAGLGTLIGDVGSKEEALAAHRRALEVRRALAAEPGASADAQAEVGQTLNDIARIHYDAGRLDDAMVVLEEASGLLEEAARAAPHHAGAKSRLSTTHSVIGLVHYRRGQYVDSLVAYERARDLRQALADAHPDVSEHRFQLAQLYFNSAINLSLTGRMPEALKSYERARDGYQSLAMANPKNLECRLGVGNSYHGIAYVMLETGSPSDALAAYLKARDAIETVAKARPAVTTYQTQLAEIQNSTANALRRVGKNAEALAEYEKAHAISRALAETHPSVPRYRANIAMNDQNIGHLLTLLGRSGEAAESFKRARDGYERLARAHPDVVAHQTGLASALHELAQLYRFGGQPDEAMKAHIWARNVNEAVAKSRPQVAQYQIEAAYSLKQIAILLREADKPAEAHPLLERALTLCEPLAKAEPTNHRCQAEIGHMLTEMGRVHVAAGRTAEAAELLRRGREVFVALLKTYPFRSNYKALLAGADLSFGRLHVQAGRRAEAFEAARRAEEALAPLPNVDCEDRYSLAAAVALKASLLADEPKAERSKGLNRAMDLLRKAVAAGYRNRNVIQRDPALDSLRGRDDFKKLLAELEADATKDASEKK